MQTAAGYPQPQTTLPYTPLQYSTLYYTKNTTPHYTTLYYTTLQYTALQYIKLQYTTPHHTTLHYTTLHSATLQYTTFQYSTLHQTALHYTTLHYTTLHRLHYTTLYFKTIFSLKTDDITLHYNAVHYITSHHHRAASMAYSRKNISRASRARSLLHVSFKYMIFAWFSFWRGSMGVCKRQGQPKTRKWRLDPPWGNANDHFERPLADWKASESDVEAIKTRNTAEVWFVKDVLDKNTIFQACRCSQVSSFCIGGGNRQA